MTHRQCLDAPNDLTETPIQPPCTVSDEIINASWDEQSAQLYLPPEPEYMPMDWQLNIHLDPELEPNHASEWMYILQRIGVALIMCSIERQCSLDGRIWRGIQR